MCRISIKMKAYTYRLVYKTNTNTNRIFIFLNEYPYGFNLFSISGWSDLSTDMNSLTITCFLKLSECHSITTTDIESSNICEKSIIRNYVNTISNGSSVHNQKN